MFKAYFRSCIGRERPPSHPPVTRWLDGIIREVGDGTMMIEHLVREDMCNPSGYLHGGIQAALMDDAIGMLGTAECGDRFPLSINLAVDFLGKAKAGSRIQVRVTLVRAGLTMMNVECRISDEAGDTIARGSSNLVMPAARAVPMTPSPSPAQTP